MFRRLSCKVANTRRDPSPGCRRWRSKPGSPRRRARPRPLPIGRVGMHCVSRRRAATAHRQIFQRCARATTMEPYLWRAVDAEGEVLDVLVQSKRNKHAALKLMRKLLKKYAFVPERFVTDDLRSYGAAARALGLEHACMSAGDGGTIGPKIRISRPDDGSARCNVSRALALRRNSFQPTPPFTTLSTSNAISYQLNRTACSASRR